MEKRGREDETRAIGETMGVHRHFGAMGMAVENAEKAHQRNGKGDWKLASERDHETEHQDRA